VRLRFLLLLSFIFCFGGGNLNSNWGITRINTIATDIGVTNLSKIRVLSGYMRLVSMKRGQIQDVLKMAPNHLLSG
jgi:hypothetical protein